jgi:hypothetical protein
MDLCGSETGKTLSNGWVKYDRLMMTNDMPGKEPIQFGSNPYFAVYNTNIGVLRTFMYVRPGSTEGATVLLTNASILGKDGGSLVHGFGLMENSFLKAVTLAQSEYQAPESWVSIMQPDKASDYWQVIDRQLSYDPWQARMENGREVEWTYKINMKAVDVSSITLNGTTLPGSTSTGGAAFFRDHPSVTALARKGVQAGVSALTSTLDDKLVDIIADPKARQEAQAAKITLNNAKATWSDKAFEGVTNLAVGAATGAMGTSLLSFILPATTTYNSISLSGELELPTAINSADVPLPGNTIRPPFYVRNQKSLLEKPAEIGLFTLTSPPKAKVWFKVEHRVQPFKNHEYGLPINSYAVTLISVFLTIDDPSCDLVFNPMTTSKFSKLMLLPKFHETDPIGDELDWQNLGKHLELPSSYTPKMWFQDTAIWSVTGGKIKSYNHFDLGVKPSNMDIQSQFDLGVDIYVEFKVEKETGSDVVTVEKLFPADVEFIAGVPDLSTSPQVCSVVENQVKDLGVKHRNVVTDIDVTTGLVDHSSTDAEVSMTLVGCDNFSESHKLDQPNFNDFEEGKMDVFSISSIFGNGPIQKVAFELENSDASWKLMNFNVKQTDLETGRVTGSLNGAPEIWIKRGAPGISLNSKGHLVWEYANSTPDLCKAYAAENADFQAKYTVKIKTADIKNAGTEATIVLKICGETAKEGEERCTEKSVSGFSRNVPRSFYYNADWLKSISSVTLLNHGDGNAWRPDDISIEVNPKASDKANVTYQFAFRQWIGANESVERNLVAGMAYDFTVKTADVKYAGTGAGIYAQLCDNEETQSCVTFKLDNPGEDNNERNSTDIYRFYSKTIIANPVFLTLYNDLDHDYSGWKPHSVSVATTDLSTSNPVRDTASFWFDQWLAKDMSLGDKHTTNAHSPVTFALDDFAEGGSVTLGERVQSKRVADRGLGFTLKIHTANDPNAGTGAGPWARVTTCGEDVHEFKLDNRDNNFQQNSTDEFHFFRDWGNYNSKIKSVALMHDASGENSGWKVNTVELTIDDPAKSGTESVLATYSETWDKWIGKDQDVVNATFTDLKARPGVTLYGFEWGTGECVPSGQPIVKGFVKVVATYTQGEVLSIEGTNLGGVASQWNATLGGNPIAVKNVSLGRISLQIPQDQPVGSQSLTLANPSQAVTWSGSVLVNSPTPAVTAISHSSRKPGEYFELLGQNFGSSESAIVVKVGSTMAPVVRLLDGRVSLYVPQMTAGTYNVTLYVNGMKAPQIFPLTIVAVIPKVTGVQPSTLAPGATLTILGTGFGSDASVIQVKIGSAVLIPSIVANERISVVVPVSMASGIYAVTVMRAAIAATGSAQVEVLRMPSFLNFDDPLQKWTCQEAVLERDVSVKSTSSGASLKVLGSGYRVIRSPRFNTAELGQFSDTLAFEVFIPAGSSNPWWLGDVQFFVDAPAAGISNQMQAQLSLTGLRVGAWNTVRVPLSAQVVSALAGDYPNMAFAIVVNAAAATGDFRLDQVRFVGSNLQYRTVEHKIGSRLLNVVVPRKLGFESSDPWTLPAGVTGNYVADPREEGLTALKVNASGFMHLVSPELRSYELSVASGKLNVDVYVPDPQPNPWWIGNVAAYLDCPAGGIYNLYLGQKDLTHLFRNEYNSVVFDISPENVARLKQSVVGCRVNVDLNVTNGPAPFLLDKMGFVHATGVEVSVPTEPPSSSSAGSTSSSSSSPQVFSCTGMCASAVPASNPYGAYTLGTTGEAWYVLDRPIAGWQGSEMAGRTVEVNGIAVSLGQKPLPAAIDGKWYVRFSTGTHSWASFSWWP